MAVTTIPFNPMDLEYRGNITANDNLDNLQPGVYYLRNEQPINCPSYHWQWSYLFVIDPGTSVIQEYIFRPSSMSICMREKSGNPMAWGAWSEVCGGTMQYRDVTHLTHGNNSHVWYWKRGNVVTVCVQYAASDGVIDAWSSKTLTTLPSELRPPQSVRAYGVEDRTGDVGACISITSGGVVAVQTRYNPLATTNGGVLQATVTYAV